MSISVAEVEEEIRRILQGGIRRSLTAEGFPDVEEEVRSIFEQLSLVLTAEPGSIYALFNLAVDQLYRKLGDYLDAVRALYSGRSLAGLPTSTDSGQSTFSTISKGVSYLHVFDQALGSSANIEKAVEYAGGFIDDIVEEVVVNVRELTVSGFEQAVKTQLEAAETAYDAIDLTNLDDYLAGFERFSLTSKSLQSVGEKIRAQLINASLQIEKKDREEEADFSYAFISLLVSAKKLLESLVSTTEVEGTVVDSPFDDLTFPDDDLLSEGSSGETIPDVVILSGNAIAPLTVTADPIESGDTTSRVLSDVPFLFALEIPVEVEDDELYIGTGYGDPIMLASGEDAEPVTPPDPTQVIQDMFALFTSYGVEAGDLWRSTDGDTVSGRWHVVDQLGTDEYIQLEVTVATNFIGGASIDYQIWKSHTNLLIDDTANFSSDLEGKRIEIIGLGSSTIVRVLDSTNLELEDYLFPIVAIDGSAPSTSGYAYIIYEFAEASSHIVKVTGGSDDLFDYDLPARTPVRLKDGSGDYFESYLEVLVDEHTFLLEHRAPEGIYTALFIYPVQPGDLLRYGGTNYTIDKVVDEDLILVSPPVDSTLSAQEAIVIPPDYSGATRAFYDESADFEADSVFPGSLLLVIIDGQVRRSKIDVVSTKSLRLIVPLPVDKDDLAYRILKREDSSTLWAESPTFSWASALVGDTISAAGRAESTITGINDPIGTIYPGHPVSLEESWAIVTRGGVPGYGHYELVQDRFFGASPTSLMSPVDLRSRIGLCVADPSDIGTFLSEAKDGEFISSGGNLSDRIRADDATFDLSSAQFGSLLQLSVTEVGVGSTTINRYVREWNEDDDLISIFPSVDITRYTALNGIRMRYSKATAALYEAYQIETSILAIREILRGFVAPNIAALDSLLAFMNARKYDRAIDLLVAGDIETLASSTELGLSYAGRLSELMAQAVPLLG